MNIFSNTQKNTLNVSLLYANAPVMVESISNKQTTQYMLTMSVAEGTSIYQALYLSGWLEIFDELKQWCDEISAMPNGLATLPVAKEWRVGIYSTKQPLSYCLVNKDRIEIYRPLIADPMKRRKNKAK